MQALQAATGWAAECLGIERDVGSIQPGKLADLLVIEGDPLQNIAVLQDLQRIKLVFKEGQLCIDRRLGSSHMPIPQPGLKA